MLARWLSIFGLLNASILGVAWYGHRFNWGDMGGAGLWETLSTINWVQALMGIYPPLLIVLFGKTAMAKPGDHFGKVWASAAFFSFGLGLWIAVTSWFIILVGGGLVALAIGLLPCLIASALMAWLLIGESPLKFPRMTKGDA